MHDKTRRERVRYVNALQDLVSWFTTGMPKLTCTLFKVWGLEADINRMTAIGGLLPDGRNKTVLVVTVRQALHFLEVDAHTATEEELANKLAELEAFVHLADAIEGY
jgi:hypothetical protein